MKKFIPINIIFIYFLFTVACFGQLVNTDSLQKLVSSPVDSIKMSALEELINHFTYTNQAIAIRYAKQAESLAEKNNLLGKKADIYISTGIIYYEKGEYYHARLWNEKALKISMNIKDSLLMARALGNIGNSFMAVKDYENALANFKKALNIFEKRKNFMGIAIANGTIGNLYFYSKKYKEALTYYKKSNEYFEQIEFKEGIAINLMNIGAILKNEKKFTQALDYLNKAFRIFEEQELKLNAAQCLANIGNCYVGLDDFNKAESYIKTAIDQLILINADESLALTYNDFGNAFLKNKKYNEALQEFEKALTLAEKVGDFYFIEKTFKDLSLLYEQTKDFEKALKFKNKYVVLHDSLLNSENENYQERLLTEFASERKDKEILIKETELQKQKILIISLITGIALFILLLYFSFTRYRIKKRANIDLTFKNAEITQQKEEILTQKEEIEAQKNEIEKSRSALQDQHTIAIRQRDEIFRQKKDITDSILYAKRIQTALLAGNERFKQVLQNGFCLFKPRDIVSGDFYWVNQIENKYVIIAADCTGHGVPGAFMSIIGITFLNEIINEKKILQPDEILNILRENVINALKSTAESMDTKDGMDMAVCVVNNDTLEMEFAGANNPIYVTSSHGMVTSPHGAMLLHTIKANKQPIGIYEQMKPFSSQMMQLHKGDTIYLMSDGFADQFGGEKNKKLKIQRLKEIISEISTRPIEMQKALLEMQFDKWKGSNDQVDDVLVIGYKC
ncbi:MAG: hypothetical protein A2309_00100 [Bacteroidetes bacterium RIFOXYB2_FULL_35_7]|nr:MAG: hypothetical protein A2309_00100 [Bacteroidetes bacterium RIFOXYB2_FULL_35_7]